MACINSAANAGTYDEIYRKNEKFKSSYAVFSNLVAVDLSSALMDKSFERFTIARIFSRAVSQAMTCINNMVNAVTYQEKKTIFL